MPRQLNRLLFIGVLACGASAPGIFLHMLKGGGDTQASADEGRGRGGGGGRGDGGRGDGGRQGGGRGSAAPSQPAPSQPAPAAAPRGGGGPPRGGNPPAARSGPPAAPARPNVAQPPAQAAPRMEAPRRGGDGPPAVRGGQSPAAPARPSITQPSITQPPSRQNAAPRLEERRRPIQDSPADGLRRDGAARSGGDRGDRRFGNDGRSPNRDGRGNNQWTPANNRVHIGNRDIQIARAGYQPSFARYNWYRGNWGNNWGWGWGGGGFGGGGFGPGGWGYYGVGRGWGPLGWGGGWRPLGWGLAGWGLGSLIYSSGYLPYYNPYYGGMGGFGGGLAGYGGGFNYSQPIPVAYDTSNVMASAPTGLLDDAIAAFRRNDYDTALNLANQAVAQNPQDSAAHEFRALALFAKADYRQAAATIHSVLALGPGWDWDTLRSMYPSVAVYTTQLRSLEQFTTENPKDAASKFLLAYHYLSGGHQDAAARQLRTVAELVPEDRVAADLLRMTSAPGSGSRTELAQQPTPQPPAEAPAPDSINAKAMVGTWQASRDDGTRFELTLNPDSTFRWKFAGKENQGQEFTGTYSTDANLLVLERADGGSLVGEVTDENAREFRFKLVGAPPDDKGLKFDKA